MNFKVEVLVSPRKDILDPQGKAVESALTNLEFTGISRVRVGKYLTFDITAESREVAHAACEEACRKLLTNPIIEDYVLKITEA